MQATSRERLGTGQGHPVHGSRPRQSQRSGLGSESRARAAFFISAREVSVADLPTGGIGGGFGGNGSGGGVGEGGAGLGGDGLSGMEVSLENRYYCSGLP